MGYFYQFLSIARVSDQKKTLLLLVVTFLSGALELCMIFLLFPIITLVVSGEISFPDKFDNLAFFITKYTEGNPVILFSCLITLIIVSAFARLGLLFLVSKFSFGLFKNLNGDLYQRILSLKYHKFQSYKISDYISSFQKIDDLTYSYIAFLNFVSATIIAFFVSLFLILFLPGIVTIGIIIIVASYIISILVFKRILYRNSDNISLGMSEKNRLILNSLSAFVEVQSFQATKFFLKIFKKRDRNLKDAQISNNVIGPTPRFLIEPLAFIVLAIIGYALTMRNDTSTAIASIATIAFGIQRLMPLLQQAFIGWSVYAGKKEVFNDIVCLFKELEIVSNKNKSLQNDIIDHRIDFYELILKDVSLLKSDQSSLISSVNFSISVGDSIALIGPSGSGKSSLLMAMAGLIPIKNGKILINSTEMSCFSDEALHNLFGIVPQNSVLVDGTVKENILFGKTEINLLKCEKIFKSLDLLKDHYGNTSCIRFLESDISKMSGGQKQRVALARALYAEKTILFFDEITSSLDSNTAHKVMQLITSKSFCATVLCIVHDQSLLNYFDRCYQIKNTKLEKIR